MSERFTPEIHTERLALRGFVQDDARDVFAYASNPNVLRHTTGRTPRTIAETQCFLADVLHKPPGSFAWAIRLRGQSQVIGAVEYSIGDGQTGTIHYALAEEYWNKGLMTEACRAVLAWGFASYPDLQKVTTSGVVENPASIRVMQKCGMTFQRIVEEKWEKFSKPVKLGVYSISRVEWDAAQNPQATGRNES